MARVSLDQLLANRPQADRTKLDATTEEDIRRHAVEDGQDPDVDLTGYHLVPAPAEIRKMLGVTQQGFADVIGVPVATLRNWEQGRKAPDPAARSLLTIMHREPEAAMRALGKGPVKWYTRRGQVHFPPMKILARDDVEIAGVAADERVINRPKITKRAKGRDLTVRPYPSKPVRA